MWSGDSMYNDGQLMGAATTATGAVVALPLTSGGSPFQWIIIATLTVAAMVIAARLIKLAIIARQQ